MRNPPCLIGKDPNSTDPGRVAKVKPVFHVGRHGQKIARRASDREYFLFGCLLVKPEKTLAVDEEPNLIFAMGMFTEKLVPDGGHIRSRGCDPDDVGGSIAVLVHKGLEPAGMGLQDVFVARTDRRGFSRPMVIPDTAFLEEMLDRWSFGEVDMFIGYS